MSSGNISSSDELDDIDIWKTGRKKRSCANISKCNNELPPVSQKRLSENCNIQIQKFETLKNKAKIIRERSRLCREKTEKRRSQKLIQKAIKDPLVKRLIEGKDDIVNDCIAEPKKEEKWQDIKPFLTVNDHFQGPVSHGDFGPKTELECLIDDAIKEEDFTRAEILSDTLADRQFAVKVAQAFKAKRCAEKNAIEEEEKKANLLKKLSWGFEAKERWQMKGNM